MSDYTHKDNTGSAFTNNYKQNERHPDYKGSCVVRGETFEVALWERKTAKGDTYYSIKFSEPYKGNSENKHTKKTAGTFNEDFAKKQQTANFVQDIQDMEDDDLPF
jgi:hypothetical protein